MKYLVLLLSVIVQTTLFAQVNTPPLLSFGYFNLDLDNKKINSNCGDTLLGLKFTSPKKLVKAPTPSKKLFMVYDEFGEIVGINVALIDSFYIDTTINDIAFKDLLSYFLNWNFKLSTENDIKYTIIPNFVIFRNNEIIKYYSNDWFSDLEIIYLETKNLDSIEEIWVNLDYKINDNNCFSCSYFSLGTIRFIPLPDWRK